MKQTNVRIRLCSCRVNTVYLSTAHTTVPFAVPLLPAHFGLQQGQKKRVLGAVCLSRLAGGNTAVVLCIIHTQSGPAKVQNRGNSSNGKRKWGHTLMAQKSVRNMKTKYTRVATMRPFSNILDSCLKGPIRNIVLQASHTTVKMARRHQH